MFCCKHKLSFLTESNDALFNKSHARTKLLVNQMVKKRSFRFMKVVYFRIFFGWSTCCWAWHFATPPIGFPRNYVWESTTEIPTVYKCHCQDLDREFDLMNKFSSSRRHYPDMVGGRINTMEFLCSLLGGHSSIDYQMSAFSSGLIYVPSLLVCLLWKTLNLSFLSIIIIAFLDNYDVGISYLIYPLILYTLYLHCLYKVEQPFMTYYRLREANLHVTILPEKGVGWLY